MIHCLVETLDRYFSNVCELDLMFNLEMVSASSTLHLSWDGMQWQSLDTAAANAVWQALQ